MHRPQLYFALLSFYINVINGPNMDCEYDLRYKTGNGKRNEFEFLFHATSPEQATSTAREIIKHHQAEAISLI